MSFSGSSSIFCHVFRAEINNIIPSVCEVLTLGLRFSSTRLRTVGNRGQGGEGVGRLPVPESSRLLSHVFYFCGVGGRGGLNELLRIADWNSKPFTKELKTLFKAIYKTCPLADHTEKSILSGDTLLAEVLYLVASNS